jgi:hypothetical protein
MKDKILEQWLQLFGLCADCQLVEEQKSSG